ncbi:CC146 protein, partial [Crypturellus undulatus]|nr:CC146 protein [Crypturellus undulatus]
LEEIFADPENETRRRILGGKDPSPPELLEKIEKLELELLRKEEKLLETDFVYEQVCRLTERARGRVQDGEADALLLAKRTSELQKKIKDRTRKMMALVAELSMRQALAIKLQQEVRDREQFLLTISSRMDQGLPLPQDTEREWLKVLRDERMQKAAAEAKAQQAAEEAAAAGPGCVRTAAEQRPNAYVPSGECGLPLPRPYGALAPFKPSEPGSNMRHIRKPVVKPIEI